MCGRGPCHPLPGGAILDTGGSYYSSSELLQSSEPLYKSGVLYKQRDVFKGWRPRKFILQVRHGPAQESMVRGQ
jgi:hypothetical protein